MDASNIMEVCRLCLDKGRETIPIFEGEGVDREICLKIGSCLPVKVTNDDPLPKKICDDCTTKVELVYAFWNTTANAEKQLLEWLGLGDPHHGSPMDLLKTEMGISRDGSGTGLSQMELADESNDILNQDGDIGDVSGEESGREEDSGGGGYKYEDGASADPSTMDVSHSNASISTTEPGPSGVQTQGATKCEAKESQQLAPNPQPQLPAEPPGYSDSSENGGKIEAPSGSQKEVCNICGKSYKASFMIIHKRTHTGMFSLECPLCETSFPSNKSLRSHMVCHSDFRPFACEVCNRKFKRNNELNMHMKIHSGEKAFQCDLCDYSCVQKSNLVVHKKRHSNEYKYKCDICDKGCYTNQELQKHKMSHMDITYKCKVCDKLFHHKYSLTIHEKKHDPHYEPPVGEFKCELCGKCYVKYSGLKVHMRKHTGVKPYTCDVCGKSVSSRAILEVHQRSHTGEKPHICEVCGKMFTSKRYLDSHIRTHTGERPFKCRECGKCFTQHSTLIVHARYHSGERPFECPVCCKGFVLRCHLRSHQKAAKHNFPENQSEDIENQEEPDDGDELNKPDDLDELDEQDEHEVSSMRDAEVADGEIIIASADDPDGLIITCYDDLEVPDKILYSCSTCKRTFSDKNKLIAHQKRSCSLGSPVVKAEPDSDSE